MACDEPITVTNEYKPSITETVALKRKYRPKVTGSGRKLGTTNLHSKQHSSISQRLKQNGVDWVADLALAIKANNYRRIAIWMKLLPYLIVTQGQRRSPVLKRKGKPDKAALAALEALEQSGAKE
jgi:hypothetical protein